MSYLDVYTSWYPATYGLWQGKTGGMGDHFAIGGYLIGGDVRQLSLHGGPALIDVTLMTDAARRRAGGLLDGGISFVTYMDPAAGQSHAALAPLPRSDVIVTYLRGQGTGYPAACCQAVQVGYDATRGADGSLTFAADCQADGHGLEWCEQLTAGLRTDTAPASGPGQDDGWPSGAGAQAYLQAVSFGGTSATVTVQHAPDNATWADLIAFSPVTTAPQAQRATASGAVAEYLRVTTSGTFSSLSFIVALNRNQATVTPAVLDEYGFQILDEGGSQILGEAGLHA